MDDTTFSHYRKVSVDWCHFNIQLLFIHSLLIKWSKTSHLQVQTFTCATWSNTRRVKNQYVWSHWHTHHCEQHTTCHFFTILSFSNCLFSPRTKKPSGSILAVRTSDRLRIAFCDWPTSTASKRTKSTRMRACCITKMYVCQRHVCRPVSLQVSDLTL